MKRFILTLILTAFLCVSASADHRSVVARKNVSAGGDCAGGSYTAYYNGDHTTGADYICYNNGGGSVQASANTADAVNTSYVEYNAANKHLQWTDANVLIDDEVGTIFFTLVIVGSINGNSLLFESYNGTDNLIRIIHDDVANAVAVTHKGDGTAKSQTGPTNLTTADISYRVGVTWQTGVAGIDCGISTVVKGNATSWNNSDKDFIAWNGANQPNKITIGENESSQPVNDTIRISDMVIFRTYEATDPDP